LRSSAPEAAPGASALGSAFGTAFSAFGADFSILKIFSISSRADFSKIIVA
jgi:hypothetical protein